MQKHNFQNSLIKKITGILLSVFFITSISAYANTNKLTVTTKTANGKHSKTDDKIYITVYGTLNDTKEFRLNTAANDLEKSSTDVFPLYVDSVLGDIIGVKLRLKGDDGWQFDYIKVQKEDAKSEVTFWKNQGMWLDDDKTEGGRRSEITQINDFEIHRIWDTCNPNGNWNGTKSYSFEHIGQQKVGQFQTTLTNITRSIVKLGGTDSTSKETESSKKLKLGASAKVSASYGVASGEASVSVSKTTFSKVIASAQSSSSFSRTEARESSSKLDLKVTEEGDYVLLSQSDFKSGVLKIGDKDVKYAEFSEVGGILVSLMLNSDFEIFKENKCHFNNL
ncbi:MAG: hypothetical protein ACJAS1_007269 [Oleiphilaceae bacterium]|jgi:hypothetical protein